MFNIETEPATHYPGKDIYSKFSKLYLYLAFQQVYTKFDFGIHIFTL